MWNNLLPTLGALTLGGSIAVILFAVTARASRTRYAARWRCWIWLLLCLRLVIPVSFMNGEGDTHSAPIQLQVPSDTVIYEYEPPVQTTVQPTVSGEPSALPDTPVMPSVPAAPTVSVQPEVPVGEPQETKPNISVSLAEIVRIIWAVGAGVMLIWTIVSHLRFLRYVRRWSHGVEDPAAIRMYNQLGDRLNLAHRPNLRTCTGLKAPMLAGLIHPKLLLPEDTVQSDALRFVLIHELTHYKRRDIWLKSLAMLTNIVHWFNPFMWYMVRLVERDTELACDEAALHQLPPEDHSAYGRTILNAVERLKLK